jgi:hypothetical protein
MIPLAIAEGIQWAIDRADRDQRIEQNTQVAANALAQIASRKSKRGAKS